VSSIVWPRSGRTVSPHAPNRGAFPGYSYIGGVSTLPGEAAKIWPPKGLDKGVYTIISYA